MPTDRSATLTSARFDAHAGPAPGTVNAALRAEALRQLRWQQREWARVLATHPVGTPCLVAPARGSINAGRW